MISFTSDPSNDTTFLTLSSPHRLTTFGIRKAWFMVGKDLLKSANEEVLKKPRHGKVYIRRTASGRMRRHVASRPSESHANFSGTLRKSMQWKVGGQQLNFGYGIAKANAPEYAKWVEEGTKRMSPRPTLANSVKANYRNAEQHLLNSVMKEFKQ